MSARFVAFGILVACIMLTGCRNRSHRQPQRPCPPGGMTIPPTGIPEGLPPAPIPGKIAPPPAANGETWLPQDPPAKSRSEYVPGRGGAILGEPDSTPAPKDNNVRKPMPSEMTKGIADFTQVKDGIGAGQRPEIEGLDWLKTKGYKTIVYVRRAGDDDTTDKRQFERREMQYVGLVVAPGTLTQEWIENFNRVVAEKKSQPLFVYGDPGSIGVIWYLHFRTAEFLTHDEARLRAGRLGVIDEKSEMFEAALKVVPRN